MAKSNQQLMRPLLGAILSSGLTDPELRELARELRSGNLAFDLADLLDTFFVRTPRHEPLGSSPKTVLSEFRREETAIRRAEAAIKRRRLSKAALHDLLESYAPPSVRQRLHESTSVTELLNTFFDSAPVDATQRFLAALETGKIDDPFLKGIRDRAQG